MFAAAILSCLAVLLPAEGSLPESAVAENASAGAAVPEDGVPAASAEATRIPSGVDAAYRLSFTTLMENDAARLESLIRSADSGEAFETAILCINHVIVTDSLKYLGKAVESLEKAAGGREGDRLFAVYKGMAEAYLARKRTVFGVENLKRADAYMTSIPADESDWYIRLLRGMSCYSLGRGLPGIGPMKAHKVRALATGKADLGFVVARYEKAPSGAFDLATYDWKLRPVPEAARDYALSVLSR